MCHAPKCGGSAWWYITKTISTHTKYAKLFDNTYDATYGEGTDYWHTPTAPTAEPYNGRTGMKNLNLDHTGLPFIPDDDFGGSTTDSTNAAQNAVFDSIMDKRSLFYFKKGLSHFDTPGLHPGLHVTHLVGVP